MEDIWAFLIQHWALSGLVVVLLIIFLANEWRQHAFGLPSLAAQELVGLINHKRAVVIDVRDQEAFAKGHILGALNITQADLENKKKTMNKFKSRPIVVVCQNGFTSPKVGQWFLDKGFTDVYYLKGGLDHWRAENLPISQH